MENVFDAIMVVWDFFAKNILTQPAYFIGVIVLIGYLLLRKPWYECLSGFLKATVGYFILSVGSGGLVNNFRPILTGLKDRFNLDATVIDPYFGQNAIDTGIMETFGRTFGDVMVLLLIAFIANILLVRFQKYTKMRAVFTTGNVQVQQAATAFWLILFCFPDLGRIQILAVMGLILGLYWAVGSNLTVGYTQELTEGAGFAVAHQQVFGIAIVSAIAGKFKSKKSKKIEDIELPGFLSIFNENMVATAILMLFFFGIIMSVLGKTYFVTNEVILPTQNFFFYILTTSLQFAVYLAILQLGVRTFVAELTESFTGISNTLLPGAVPGIDVAATFAFGSPNAVTLGFLFGALGQFLTIGLLILFKSPVVIIAGFIPLFFDNAAFAVYANNRGGIKAACILPFLSGIIQVGGSALIASWVGLSKYGGYLGMFDWATVWPGFTVIMKLLGYVGIVIVVLILVVIPQLQYRRDPEGYFLVVEDYDAYAERKA
ncbi:PTS ascorbate transporter subunit IIC [Lactococcus hodotermopsidis]|uniref:Ascorbate-specific PTS system EIIC component n=1 Tax=Pseudolactococcus hodotermopsidis TaxID=2709157 RepID=A0A6A0BDK9_9LACT|nr:PTS ascorbate transporter subunit IIC [Lactococcus hodotermopsidis]GFH42441.1 PTS ascorbate transporter subunit IIC [Lactococcus hodotermopsidis]